MSEKVVAPYGKLSQCCSPFAFKNTKIAEYHNNSLLVYLLRIRGINLLKTLSTGHNFKFSYVIIISQKYVIIHFNISLYYQWY